MGSRQASITGDGQAIFVIDADDDWFANTFVPDIDELVDLVWTDEGILALGRVDDIWTLTAATYDEREVTIVSTRGFAAQSAFADLRFAGSARDGQLAMHDVGTDRVLSGTIDDYGNDNGNERGSSLEVITLPAAALSAWYVDPGQLITVDLHGELQVGDRVVPGEFRWARR